MAKSLRSIPGQKQKYNLYDTSDLNRALKAINERISEIERTWGQDSQIYRDYTAPLRTINIQNAVRVDSKGRIKFKTGKQIMEQAEDIRTSVTKMLSKKTKGDIIESTRKSLGVGKTVNEPNFMTGKQIKQLAEEYRAMYDELDSLLRELYDLEKDVGDVCRELGVEYVLEGNWGNLNYNELKTAIDKLRDYISKNAETSIFGGKDTL